MRRVVLHSTYKGGELRTTQVSDRTGYFKLPSLQYIKDSNSVFFRASKETLEILNGTGTSELDGIFFRLIGLRLNDLSGVLLGKTFR